MAWRVICAFLFSTVLGACSTLTRLDMPPRAIVGRVAPAGFAPDVRFSAFDANALRVRFTPKPESGCANALALSGGGSGGAFGAGALSGWTGAGTRPRFDIVTGVSTGALAAPFAFAGPTWDPQLKEAFTGGWSQDLLRPSGAGALFGTSVFEGRPLRDLIVRFITPELVAAVAAEARTGRALLVATTNLDTQETVVWDMGAIAQAGGDKALSLFRDVLAASASAPGVFPPVMIRVQDGAAVYEEMHVDGGVTTPFFVAPYVDAGSQVRDAASACANVFVIVNAGLADPATTTRRRTIDIAGRALNALMNQTVRSELLRIDALARLHGAAFKFALVPTTYGLAGAGNFNQPDMTRLFAYAERCAQAGALWMAQISEPQAGRAAADPSSCPAAAIAAPTR